MPVVVGFTTLPQDQAQRIANALIESEEAACVSIFPPVTSVYRWQGSICSESEVLLMIKADQNNCDSLVKRIKDLHPYDVPEIVFLPVIAGYEPYLKWVEGASYSTTNS